MEAEAPMNLLANNRPHQALKFQHEHEHECRHEEEQMHAPPSPQFRKIRHLKPQRHHHSLAGKGVLFSAAATIAAATPADLVSARELALYSLALGITIIVTRTNSLPRRGDEESPLKALFSILRLIADALPISLLGWGLVALPEAGAVATSRLLVPYIITIFAQKLIERRAPSLLPSRVASLPFVAWRAYQAMRGVSIAQCIGVPFLAAAAANSLAAVALVDLGLRFAQLPSKLRSEMHHPAGVDNRQEMEGAGLFDGVGGGVLSRELLLEMKGLQTSPPNRESGRRAALRSIGRDDDQSNQRTLQMLEAYSRKRSPGQAGALSHKSTADTYLVPTPVARRDNQHGTDAPQGDCEGGIQPVEPHVIKRKTQGGYTLGILLLLLLVPVPLPCSHYFCHHSWYPAAAPAMQSLFLSSLLVFCCCPCHAVTISVITLGILLPPLPCSHYFCHHSWYPAAAPAMQSLFLSSLLVFCCRPCLCLCPCPAVPHFYRL
jgi:hypothetical protein